MLGMCEMWNKKRGHLDALKVHMPDVHKVRIEATLDRKMCMWSKDDSIVVSHQGNKPRRSGT